jgi:tetratricopeptide (TPR) repeat protein
MTDEQRAVSARFSEALALQETERWQDAADAFTEVAAKYEGDAGGPSDLRLGAMYFKVTCLHETAQPDDVIAAADEILAYSGDDDSAFAAKILADVLWLKSRAFGHRGSVADERKVLHELIERYGARPEAADQVARAMYNEGVHLKEEGAGEQAVKLWDELYARPSGDLGPNARFVPIRGQLMKAAYLSGTGRLDAALLICEQMQKEAARQDLPGVEIREAQSRCFVAAKHSRGLRRLLRRTSR